MLLVLIFMVVQIVRLDYKVWKLEQRRKEDRP